MAELKKNNLKNTLKEDIAEGKTGKPKKEKVVVNASSKSSFAEKFSSLFAFAYNERFQKIFGLTLLLFSVYLAIAFTSFVMTWESDQDKVLGNLFSSEVVVENWLGKIGALLAHVFIHKWFGIASFIFAFLSFVTVLRITFNIGNFNFKKVYSYSFFFLIFTSVTLSYVFNDALFYLGGAFGYTMNTTLNSILGYIGTGVLLLFSFVVFLVAAFNVSFDLSKKEIIAEDETAAGPEEEIKENVFKEDTVKEKAAETPLMNSALEITNEPKHDIVEEVEKPAVKEVVLSTLENGVEFTLENPENKEAEVPAEVLAETETLPFGEYDPTLDLSSYQFPTLDLLEDYGGSKDIVINTEELNLNKDRILKTLSDYGIEIEKIKATVGPTVTLYEIIPAAGVRISKIKNLEDDIALSLSALGIRIIAPIPGKGTIGIEVPNQHAEMVPMRTILASEKFQNTTMDLPIALGKTISNETFITDLTKMPHLLMAGATGQGKSVGLNAILVSLLYKKHPLQIKFVLFDPKKLKLTIFNKF